MAKDLEKTFTVEGQSVKTVDKGNVVPNWYTDGIDNYNNWWSSDPDAFYYYSINNDRIFIQYGQNAEGWASTIFIVQQLDANETVKGNNAIEVDGKIIVEMIDSVVTEYAGAGVQATTKVTLNGKVIKDRTGMTNEGSRLGDPVTVDINEIIDPQKSSDTTRLTMRNTYPNGEYSNSSVTLGLTLENPNLAQYIPMAIRINGEWVELDANKPPQQDDDNDGGNDNGGNDNGGNDNGGNDNGGNDNGDNDDTPRDPNNPKNYNLYNIKFNDDNNINFVYDADGTDPNYPFNRPHLGIDLNFINEELLTPVAGEAYYFNDPLPSAQGGTGYGNHVIIHGDDDYWYLFGHLDHATINNGQRVEIGEQIAVTDNTGDSTGPHLHFEVRRNSVASLSYGGTGTPIDPEVWREWVRNGTI